jgi:hypothetical protein
MLIVVLVLLGLFLAGFCLVGLPRGVGQIVAGVGLVVMSVTVASVPVTTAQPASHPAAQPFVMQLKP